MVEQLVGYSNPGKYSWNRMGTIKIERNRLI